MYHLHGGDDKDRPDGGGKGNGEVSESGDGGDGGGDAKAEILEGGPWFDNVEELVPGPWSGVSIFRSLTGGEMIGAPCPGQPMETLDERITPRDVLPGRIADDDPRVELRGESGLFTDKWVPTGHVLGPYAGLVVHTCPEWDLQLGRRGERVEKHVEEDAEGNRRSSFGRRYRGDSGGGEGRSTSSKKRASKLRYVDK